jgi:protein-tyrosine kinase
MSIVDAISKAKKIAKQEHARELSNDIARAAQREELPAAAPEPVVALQPLTPIEPVLVEVDLMTCRRNRVLLAGLEADFGNEIESAYRMLRTRLLQRARTQGWMTIGITSACPDDGKTLTALNLALSLAKEKNNDIVLLDLDMRNPSMFGCLGISPPNHMLEYFEGKVAAKDLFVSIGVENLILAGGAAASAHSSELLSSSRFENLIGCIKNSTSKPLVVIDLPPVLSTDDALVLAPRLDAILIVTSEGRTTREDLKRAAESLAEFRIAGFVLNRSQHAVKGYGYY